MIGLMLSAYQFKLSTHTFCQAKLVSVRLQQVHSKVALEEEQSNYQLSNKPLIARQQLLHYTKRSKKEYHLFTLHSMAVTIISRLINMTALGIGNRSLTVANGSILSVLYLEACSDSVWGLLVVVSSYFSWHWVGVGVGVVKRIQWLRSYTWRDHLDGWVCTNFRILSSSFSERDKIVKYKQ